MRGNKENARKQRVSRAYKERVQSAWLRSDKGTVRQPCLPSERTKKHAGRLAAKKKAKGS